MHSQKWHYFCQEAAANYVKALRCTRWYSSANVKSSAPPHTHTLLKKINSSISSIGEGLHIYKLTILQQHISQVQSFSMKSVPNKCSNCTWSARCEINKKLERLFSAGGNYASRSCRSWTKETFAKVNGGREGLVAIAGCSSVLFSNVYLQIETLSSKLLFFWKIVSSNVLR